MPFLLATPVAEAAVATTARVAIPKLVKYLAKNGGDKLIKKYGQNAFEAVLGTTAGVAAYNKTAEKVSGYVDSIGKDTESTSSIPKGSMEGVDRMKQMDAVMAVPNVNKSVRETGQGLVIGGEAKEILPPPEPFSTPIDSQTATILSTPIPEKVDTTLSTPIPEKIDTKESFPDQSEELSKPIIYNKDDVSKQTKDLVPEKPKFGKLTKVEKQTALALKGDKPDFYSRAVEAITNAKQDKSTKGKWKSIVQSNSTKDEMEYLGLDKYLQGNESITKGELLKFVEEKNIAPGITVTSIPKDEMNPLYGDYSLGYEKKGTQEHIVFQIGKDQGTVGKLYKEPHFGTEYGTGTFAHGRTQVGYGDPKKIAEQIENSPSEDNTINIKLLELAKKLKNTSIVDEIQSQHLQTGAKKGFVSDFEIVPGGNLLEYLKNNNIEYRISGKGKNTRDIEIQVKPGVWEDEPGFDPFNENMDYIFNKNEKSLRFIYDPEEETKYDTPEEFLQNAYGIVPDFPIKESKKWVELVMRKLIDKAIKEGRDSIAFTNGQIQYNRYPNETEANRQGLKKFYKRVVYDQANKFAKEYNFELENLTIPNKESSELFEEEDYKNIRKNVRISQDSGYVLQKIPVEILQELTNNVSVPGHASFYSSTGKGQGVDYILNNIDQEYREAVGMGNVTTDYYIWSKEPITLDIQKIENLEEEFKKIVWELPIVPTKDASENEVVKSIVNLSTLERDSIFKQFHIGSQGTYPYRGENLNNIDLIQYTEYLQNYKQPEGVDIGYDKDPEVLIKLKFPKKLQKDILSKPIKLTKLEAQTNKMLT